VDEAHAMPPDTLEELRLLYNLQVGNAKLLQIVLFGQPELNAKLDQPNMRQLKDRIVHHFDMQPLSRHILDSYLMFRMRAAGYHGPNVFSPGAIKLIADASSGLMRRVNILADKSLLAAFVEDTYYIKPQHVQAALRDSELGSVRKFSDKKLLLGSATAALLLISLTAWWLLNKPQTSLHQSQDKPATLATAPTTPAQETKPVIPQPDNARAPSPDVKAKHAEAAPAVAANPTPKPVLNQAPPAVDTAVAAQPPVPVAGNHLATGKTSLFEKRLAAGKQLLEQKKSVASIQLFYNEEINAERTEGFLMRADKLGVLNEIYLLPAKFGNKNGMRVLYGAYPSIDAAHKAIKELPAKYQQAFATSTYIF